MTGRNIATQRFFSPDASAQQKPAATMGVCWFSLEWSRISFSAAATLNVDAKPSVAMAGPSGSFGLLRSANPNTRPLPGLGKSPL
jgi:hypothetical protein